ncbi:hypothetical protein [Streptomyces atratus]|uniref:hypothetical protein n=1 Tax=Streptomyces atratus TaxID=1893 RepID=UPI002259578A|nr:hypothetical protein [Streptomyces atratus]MCX5340263.1 hypothetical protein [Streptomyces atratus]
MSPGTVAPAVDWNDRLAAARPEEFAELFHEAITEDFGAVARLHQMLETASEWCRAHGARSSASELDALADRLTDLGEELHLVGEDVGHEMHSRSHRAAAATRVSPTVSVRGTSVIRQSEAPAHFPPPTIRSLPRSR